MPLALPKRVVEILEDLPIPRRRKNKLSGKHREAHSAGSPR
jgi:hypothetical protein